MQINLKRLPFIFFVALVATFVQPFVLVAAVSSSTSTNKVLAKAVLKSKQVVIGPVLAESDEYLKLLDLEKNEEIEFRKSDIQSLRMPITEREAAYSVGLPCILAWRVADVIPRETPMGHIAKLDGGIVYLTLGTKTGIRKGHALRVFRGEAEIKDPSTGHVLGKERRLVARLEVTDVFDSYSKTKTLGDLEPDLKVGDIVEPAASVNSLAVFPFVDSDGNETRSGRDFCAQLNTSLVKKGMPVVERTMLGKVLVELAIQNTALFDSEKAQSVGKQLGARAVLLGSIGRDGQSSTIRVRLVDVESGKMLFAEEYQLTTFSRNQAGEHYVRQEDAISTDQPIPNIAVERQNSDSDEPTNSHDVLVSASATYTVSSANSFPPLPSLLNGDKKLHVGEFAFHTTDNPVPGQSIRIDLGRAYPIARIWIENRRNTNPQVLSRSRKIEVWLSNEDGKKGQRVWAAKGPKMEWTIAVPNISARFVTIAQPPTISEPLHLAHVKIFANAGGHNDSPIDAK